MDRRKYYCLANTLYVAMNWETLRAQTRIPVFMDYHPKNLLKKKLNQQSDFAFMNHDVYRQKKFKKKRRLKLQATEWDSRLRVNNYIKIILGLLYLLELQLQQLLGPFLFVSLPNGQPFARPGSSFE